MALICMSWHDISAHAWQDKNSYHKEVQLLYKILQPLKENKSENHFYIKNIYILSEIMDIPLTYFCMCVFG